MSARTLTSILLEAAKNKRKGITFIEMGGQDVFLAYKNLMEDALKVLGSLQKRGLGVGDELVFQIEDNQDFLTVFWACILGGIIPVPLTVGVKKEHLEKIINVWNVLCSPYLIATADRIDKLETISKVDVALTKNIKDHFIDVSEVLNSKIKSEGAIYRAKPDDIGFIQFSSGSTGTPKGVVLTHRNLLTNMDAIAAAADYSSRDTMLSWMPLTHDMGMIGFHLNPLLMKMNQYLIPTSFFVRRPAIWFDKASEYGTSILCSPNFGYKYILKHCPNITDFNWDLSEVRLIYNGAEPISERLCYEFLDHMESVGLRSNAMCPVYGLAEASLAVSISGLEDDIISYKTSRAFLNFGDKVVPPKEKEDAVSFLNVGKVIHDCYLRIGDENHTKMEDGTVGNILIKGTNVTKGYYNNPEATQEVLRNGWLKTGDLGFIVDDNLYIVGRSKDVIFVNGQNYYPHDIEQIAEEVEGVELNKIALAGFFDLDHQKEIVIAFIFHRGNLEKFVPVAEATRTLINMRFGFEIDHIVPVKDIPRTTSGKLQRFKLLKNYREGKYHNELLRLNAMLRQIEIPKKNLETPRNQIEILVQESWKSVLDHQLFGVTDKFFEVGGNSLKVAELQMKFLKEFNVELSLETLYKMQTIREQAMVIENSQVSDYQPIPETLASKYYPLSSRQKRLYYFWELNPKATAYNMPVAFEILGNLKEEGLSRSLNELVKRHDSLRTSFEMLDEPYACVSQAPNIELMVSEVAFEHLERALQGFVKPFDLRQQPLFRMHILRTQEKRQFLFLDFHHIISDGMSIYNFVKELLDGYDKKHVTKPLVQYKDFVHWERERLSKQKLQDQKQYWFQEFQDELPVLEMPNDFARPAIFDTKGNKITFELPKKSTQKLKNIALGYDCTLHTLLLSLYYVLLSKYTGSHDIIIGLPVSGRRHPDLDKIQGMFVNNLPIRLTLETNVSFSEIVAYVHHKVLKSLQHQDYPFDTLVDELDKERDISRNPIFDTMFMFHDASFSDFVGDSISLSRYTFDPESSKFDISMEIFDHSKGITYGIEYAKQLFDKPTILQFGVHFKRLALQLIENPEISLKDFDVLSEDIRQQRVVDFNATEKKYPLDKTIHGLFEIEAKKSASCLAVIHDGESLTFKELNEKADQLANFLKKAYVTKGDPVGIILEKSPKLIIGILAILKAGGHFVPIAIDLPNERIQYILKNSGCKGILTSLKEWDRVETLCDVAKDNRPWMINLDQDFPEYVEKSENVHVSVNDLAYVIYTSGTTGNPKGVMIAHKSLVNYTSWASEVYVKREKHLFPLYSSISFDLTITSIFTPLITGNTIVIYNDTEEKPSITRVIEENKVSIIKLTPSHLRLILAMKLWETTFPTFLQGLIIGGEKLEQSLVSEVYKVLGEKVVLYNEYGPTEATVGCMFYQCHKDDQCIAVPIGKPIANTQIYVLDTFMNPVMDGVLGELYISGAGVGVGYLKEKELTDRKFVNNPFIPGQKMYKTGDIAKYIDKQSIEFVGRIDQQVKINGHRIELLEIENQLLSLTDVEEAVVSIYENGGRKMICAYCVLGGTAKNALNSSILRSQMVEKLPYYMIPAYYHELKEIPLTSNGKVDYKVLPIPALNAIDDEDTLPKNKIEELVLQVWKDIFEDEKLTVRTNFFEIGGDSIKAVQISSRLNGLGVNVKAKDILLLHTIEQISNYANLGDNRKNEWLEAKGELALNPIQSWFFRQQFVNPNYYNQSVLLQIHGEIDIKILSKSFEHLIKEHDGLRINYNKESGKLFYNENHSDFNFFLEEHTLSEGDYRTLMTSCNHLRKKIDIEKTLLLKAGVFLLNTKVEFLFISIHHLIIDGISWRILLEDLHHIYNALKEGKTITLPQKTASLLDWNKGLMEFSKKWNIVNQEEYWSKIAKERFSIPLNRQTKNWSTENSAKIKRSWSEEKTLFLRKDAHKAYTTNIPILLHVALLKMLKKWTNEERFLIEIENHGRHLEDINVGRTVGWFTSLYPVLFTLKEESVGEQIKIVKERIKSVPHHGLGYGIHQLLHDKNQINRAAIRFNFLGEFGKELNNELFSFSQLETGMESDDRNHMTAELEFNGMILDGQLQMEIIYNTKAHDHETIDWIMTTFFDNLEIVLNHLRTRKDISYTPSDFEGAEIDQEELDTLFN
ncbi:amino acid adenylation domain-containing protein [Spongiimicrobium salis]|uniref:amino acid adenylation domain-containing protein n=1 Tax=Spongiimicrobium salis TaxID=1667022 RepID=UPI00374DB1D5